MQLASGELAQRSILDDQVNQRQHFGGSRFTRVPELCKCALELARFGGAKQALALGRFRPEQGGNEVGARGHAQIICSRD